MGANTLRAELTRADRQGLEGGGKERKIEDVWMAGSRCSHFDLEQCQWRYARLRRSDMVGRDAAGMMTC